MKTLFAIAILAASISAAFAQSDFGPYSLPGDKPDPWRQYRQEQDIRELERRNRELENRWRELERQRFEAERWRNDPLRPPIELRKCRPGQTLC